MRRDVGGLGFGPVGVTVGDGAGGARAGVLLVQGVGVDEGAVAGLWLRAVVEYPDDLGMLVGAGGWCAGVTYGDHGEEDVAGSRGFKGSDGRVHERVDG